MSTSKHIQKEDDTISYCGSISGETFSSSRRRKNTCSLRQHKHDALARKLKEYNFEDGQLDDASARAETGAQIEGGSKFNTCFHHYRIFVVLMGGTSLGLMVLLRYNITVAILNMVNQTALYMHEHPNKTIDDFLEEGYTIGGEFNWDNEIQHMIMSWYMIAYTLPQVVATKLGLFIGVRWATPISLAICAIATLLTPWAAYLGWEWVILLRLVNGIGASAVLPMMLTLIEQWMLPKDISFALTIAQIQQSMLTAFNPLVTGYLSAIHWSFAFYVSGIGALLFCVIWLLTVTNRPDENWFISQKELNYLCSCPVPAQQVTADEKPVAKKKGLELDSRRVVQPGAKTIDVLREPSFYAFIVLWCFHCSSYSNLSYILPTYLRQFLKIKVSQNGWYCFCIQLGCQVAILWPHPLLKFLQRFVSLSVASKIGMAVICLGGAATFLLTGLLHQFQLPLLFVNRCFHPAIDIVATGALMINYSRTGFSSVAFSMINTVGNLSVVFTSTTLGYVLDVTAQSVAGWSGILYALAFSHILMMIIFCCFIRAEPLELRGQRKRRLELEAKHEMKDVSDIS